VTSLTWLLLDPRSSYSWKSPLTVVPELRLHQIPELRRFLIPWTSSISNHPVMDSRFANRSLIRLLFLRIIRRSAKCMRFIRISSWMFPSHETELSIPSVIHEFIHEFCKSDVSRVKRFLSDFPTLWKRLSESLINYPNSAFWSKTNIMGHIVFYM
jgi:hypothetical protein